MKKFLMAVLVLLSLFAFAACGGKKTDDGDINVATPVITLESDNSVTWQSAENATSYVVELNGTEQQAQTTTSFPAQTSEGQYSIRVKGVNGEKVSEWSNTVTYTVEAQIPLLEAPVLKLNSDNSIEWATVEGATSYIVEINGTLLSENVTQTSFAAITEEGEYSIRVKSVGDVEGKWSNTVTYTVEKVLVLKELVSPVSLLRQSQQSYVNQPVGTSSIITDYAEGSINVQPNVSLEWLSPLSDASFLVELATDENFTNTVYSENTTKNYVRIYNLYKNTQYFWRVTVTADGRASVTESSNFTTANSGPRVVYVDGVLNTRDIGGYVTESGKTTLQGMLYRGSEMDGAYVITEAGIKTMLEEFGIKSDMDLRGAVVTESALGSSVTLAQFAILNYTNAFVAPTQTELYRQVFSFLADKDNYPVYFHCQGGADRTGTVAFLLNGLLGVSFADLVRDHEFTSFSSVGVRQFFGTEGLVMQPVYEKLMNEYVGDTLSEKIENYMLSIGVTETEIYNIKAIMFGEETKEIPTTLTVPTSINEANTTAMKIAVEYLGSKQISKVFIGGNEVVYEFTDGIITVNVSEFASVANGTVTGTVLLSDETEIGFSFEKLNIPVKFLTDYIEVNTELNASSASVESVQAVEYNAILRGVLQSTHNGASGGLGISIGSYGVYLRGGNFRIYYNGAEAKRDLAQMASSVNIFENGDTAFELRIETLNESTVRLHIKTELVNGGTTAAHMYGTYDMTRNLSDEISSENAKVKLWISSGDIPTLTVKSDGGTGANLEKPDTPDDGIVMLSSYISAGTVLDSTTTSVTSSNAVGYGVTVKCLYNTEGIASGASGGTYIYIGSYGVYLRGGQVRGYHNGTEIRDLGLSGGVSTHIFEDGEYYLELGIEIKDENTVTMILNVYRVDGDLSDHNVSYTWEFDRTNEISSEEAKITMAIKSGDVTSLTILSETAA